MQRHAGGSLELENQFLRERIAELEGLLGMRPIVPRSLGLTRKERDVLGLLMRRDNLHKEQLMTALYGMQSLPPDIRIIDVWVHRVRRKLAPHEINIVTVIGHGWHISAGDKAKLAAMLEQENGRTGEGGPCADQAAGDAYENAAGARGQ